MDAIVVYESVYGNTHAVAEAVAEGLGGASVLSVRDAARGIDPVDLIVVGGPTHMHGLTTAHSRQNRHLAAEEDGATGTEPNAAEKPGLREWLRELPDGKGAHAAAFDTKLAVHSEPAPG